MSSTNERYPLNVFKKKDEDYPLYFPAVHYRDRLQWDSSTGLFSLSGLKMEDIGEYEVRNIDQNIITVFQLNVYKDNVPVSKPHVNVTRNEYRCTLLCTVDKGTRATLSWYREGEKESYGSSPVESAPHLHLLLPVERSGTYTCEAKNSVSNETASITVGAHCTGGAAGIWQTEGSKMWSLCLVLIVMLCSRLV
ncbi:T-lymphocyte surface antigen Ly-9-like isoform X2 [Anguilla anguilla]|uniref:T-lymphocyte surface antigen Ly-9-like isoform X2 n=1 Tax=Anguilla anguilla TaxID=7936 RepID=UPI0015AB0C05|nr:T-lymphocyte surface antigen Ly-9-like isoform X2 [Anguilla anguilla]